MTRGVPGTHDIDLMLHFFKKIQTMRTKKGNIVHPYDMKDLAYLRWSGEPEGFA